jgi:RNA polymerase primary sigma factor
MRGAKGASRVVETKATRSSEPQAAAPRDTAGKAGAGAARLARAAAGGAAGAKKVPPVAKAAGTARPPRARSRVSLELNKAKKSHFDEGSLDQYLKEISQYPLITREEEVELAKRIKKGDQAALEKLCRSNLRFVVSVAKKYQNQGVSLADLINEGNLGLIRAAHKFDETKGIKFISYAVWWIRQAILQALAEQSRIVRVPLNRAGTLHRIGKKSNSLLQELGREPTVEEIADGMDISLEEVRKTMSISQSHLSLDAPLTPGEDNKLLDYLPDEYNPSPDDNAFERALGEAIQESLDTLKPREAKILKLYYGLDNQEAMTLEEIGSVLGITRERVRQIKEKALSRLRHVSRARALQSFLT